jgi:hypothetical protein
VDRALVVLAVALLRRVAMERLTVEAAVVVVVANHLRVVLAALA